MPVLLEKGVNTRNSSVPRVLQIFQRQTPEEKKTSPHSVTSQFYGSALIFQGMRSQKECRFQGSTRRGSKMTDAQKSIHSHRYKQADVNQPKGKACPGK